MISSCGLRLASVVLLATSFLSHVFGQNPSTISITRAFSYLQTAPETLVADQPTLIISVGFAQPVPTNPTIQAVSNGVTLTFQKEPSPQITLLDGTTVDIANGTETYTARKSFSDNSELSAAFLGSPITINITNNGGTTNITFIASTTPPPALTRIVNFDALQEWDGASLSVFWVPIPGTNALTAPSLIVRNSNGTRIYPENPFLLSDDSDGILLGLFPSPNPTPTVPPGVIIGPAPTAQTINSISSSPGEIFFGKLTANNTPIVSSTAGATVSTRQSVAVRFPIKRPAPAPIITAQPASLTAIAGTTATLSPMITASGATYVWQKNGTLIPGATNATLTLTSVKPTDAGAYTVTATNSGGSVTSAPATLTVLAATVAPTISAAPANLTVLAGAKSTLSVTPAGTAPFSYQWLRNGTPITAATSATLTLDATLVTDAASYSVRITNSAGSVTSSAATLTVTPITRISNISVLTSLADLTDNFTLGYVVGGNTTTGPKPLLLRAAGPALAALGVAGTLDDPKLELFAGSTKTAENDNWAPTASIASTLTTAFTAVGAFPFPSPTSKDAATNANLTTRDNSVKISAASTATTTGLVLAEIYDATPADTFTTATPRLLNVSVLKSLGTGLTVGFTIAGTTPKTVLIRAIGPTLGDFGVPGTVADPQLTLFSATSPTPLATNDNWSVPVASAPNATALTAAFTSVGAFALPATSRDAALLTTLPPGGYSVQVTGVNNTTGAALVEVYEVP